MKIAVFGLGYVGTVNAACLAELGHEIIGNDIKQFKVDRMNEGISPVKEPKVEDLIRRNIGKNLKATTDIRETLENSEIGIICVGTPLNYDNKTDTSRIVKVFDEIVMNVNKPYTIVVRSTVPPGTISSLRERVGDKKINVIMNPEFLREGSAVDDFFDPDLIVIGTSNKDALGDIMHMYRGIKGKFMLTDEKTAEMIKYVNNSWHALKIAFTNEISSVASKKGIDPNNLMQVFCGDEKLNISTKYHKPGFAYGGSCLTKDPEALISMAHLDGLNIPLIQALKKSNEEHLERALRLILMAGEKDIGVFGISFKYDGSSGDMRGSPVITLINKLIEVGYLKLFEKGYNIKIYDPHINLEDLEAYLPHFKDKINNNFEEVIKNSKVLLIGNILPELKDLPDKLEDHHIVIDLQGAFKPSDIKKGKYVGLYS